MDAFNVGLEIAVLLELRSSIALVPSNNDWIHKNSICYEYIDTQGHILFLVLANIFDFHYGPMTRSLSRTSVSAPRCQADPDSKPYSKP